MKKLTITPKLGKVENKHRPRLEQRYIGVRYVRGKTAVYLWGFVNRFRLEERFAPLMLCWKNNRALSRILSEEVFVGFGKKAGECPFNSNRAFANLRVKLSDKLSIEAGYISQILQQGAKVNNQTVFQDNSGINLNVITSFKNNMVFE
jgi:hypothetical protein